ncbi:HNH endonuclease signature motif containing protein [Amycolatopsis sp. VC5-11]|uniref:HNH endonuclease signature motif containing protein n=1 Tax=Amycolatopsis sp. VC5-11 TaxID=3120156 RepID=UPI00300AD144
MVLRNFNNYTPPRPVSVPENWRRVPGAAGYLISDAGRLMSICGREARILRPSSNRKGYQLVKVHGLNRSVHRLVLEAFVGPRPEGQEARHLNGNPADNRLHNLAWGTSSQNKADMVRHGTHNCARRTACPAGHEYVDFGYRDCSGKRRCGRCERDRSTARRQAKAADHG